MCVAEWFFSLAIDEDFVKLFLQGSAKLEKYSVLKSFPYSRLDEEPRLFCEEV
jgi:hypothetical protein